MPQEKLALQKHCAGIIQQKIDTLREVLQQIAESKAGETKSSAGDKFETSRTMLQREEEQYGGQLLNALKQQEQLDEISRNLAGSEVAPGCLVVTKKKRHYYLAIGLGKVGFADKTYFCISAAAPIGEVLLGLKKGESFSFNGQKDEIVEIK